MAPLDQSKLEPKMWKELAWKPGDFFAADLRPGSVWKSHGSTRPKRYYNKLRCYSQQPRGSKNSSFQSWISPELFHNPQFLLPKTKCWQHCSNTVPKFVMCFRGNQRTKDPEKSRAEDAKSSQILDMSTKPFWSNLFSQVRKLCLEMEFRSIPYYKNCDW